LTLIGQGIILFYMQDIIATGGRVKGRIREVGNRKELLTPGGQVLGYYDEDKDMTYKTGGYPIGLGDQLMTLLEN
jgi:hypothetical protein